VTTGNELIVIEIQSESAAGSEVLEKVKIMGSGGAEAAREPRPMAWA